MGKENEGLYINTMRKLSKPIVKLFAYTNMTPNQISLLGLFLDFVAGYLISTGQFKLVVIGGIFIQISFVFDLVDGMVARLRGLTSSYGEWADTIMGDLGSFAIIFGFGIGGYRQTSEIYVLYLLTIFLMMKHIFTFQPLYTFNLFGYNNYKKMVIDPILEIFKQSKKDDKNQERKPGLLNIEIEKDGSLGIVINMFTIGAITNQLVYTLICVLIFYLIAICIMWVGIIRNKNKIISGEYKSETN